MTMILDAFLGNFKEMLVKMAEEEVGMLLGIPGEIEKLGRIVGDIQCVLFDAEKKQTKGSAIERWLLQLKDLMYDADDLMDLCQMKAEDRRARYRYPSSSKFSCGMNVLSCFRNPIFAHKIGTKIKELISRLDEISRRKLELGLIESELQTNVGPSNVYGHSDVSRRTDPSVVLDDIVGDEIEEDTARLVKLLNAEGNGRREHVTVVAIVGMAGIGKTTLVKKIYNDPELQRFDLKLWVCVSKDLKEVQLLKCIIREAGGNHGAAEERSELVPMLARMVQGKKFFLVLDDVWPESQEVWSGLLRDAMIGGARGCRLLVTTRDDRVARFFHATTTHHVQKLSDEDAWSLLVKQVALDEFGSENLKDIGLELVQKCDGLPLAIKAIGGVIRGREKTKTEWQVILKSNLWSLDDLSSDFPRSFYLSYEDLSSHLKQCFIYCSLFPEDFEFDIDDLAFLWQAEGFLSDKGDLSFYELGVKYHKELILRNLLEVQVGCYNHSISKMHDLVRSFAGYLRKSDCFIMGEGKLSDRRNSLLKLRRLSIEGSVLDSDLDFLNKEKYLRSLLIVNNPTGDILSKTNLSFPHLRILNLSNSNISSLSDSFCDLVQLRYLNLQGTKLEALPNSIGNLRKLEVLDLGECNLLSHVPSSIVNMLELRSLNLNNTNIEVLPAGLRKLKKLINLCAFRPNIYNSKEDSSLEDLGTLFELTDLTLCSLERAFDINVAKKANLKEMAHLKHLFFCYRPNRYCPLPEKNQECQVSKSIKEKKAAEDVINALSPPPSLEKLQIYGYFGQQLPNWLHMRSDLSKLKFLRYLRISECECFSQLSPLGQLPNLDYLQIEYAISVVRIGQEFLLDDSNNNIATEVSHSSMVPFSQLNHIVFIGMSSWVEWLWQEGQPAMPKLKKLIIDSCPNLSSLPKGLSHHATSLEHLSVNAAEQLESIEDLQSVQDLRISDNPNLERISNLLNVSFILIQHCPKLRILENLKSRYRMELFDDEMETLPGYLRKAEPEKLTIWCSKELLLTITNPRVGSSERQKFEHIPLVKIYTADESLYAAYHNEPFCFTTNVDSSADATSSRNLILP